MERRLDTDQRANGVWNGRPVSGEKK